MQRKPQQGAPIGVQNLSRAPLLPLNHQQGSPVERGPPQQADLTGCKAAVAGSARASRGDLGKSSRPGIAHSLSTSTRGLPQQGAPAHAQAPAGRPCSTTSTPPGAPTEHPNLNRAPLLRRKPQPGAP